MSKVLDNATIIHYDTMDNYNAFRGVDLVPENWNMFPKNSPWGPKLEHHTSSKIRAGTCDTKMEDGSTWTITRIGPFKTRGG
jgi:hypothetical protein